MTSSGRFARCRGNRQHHACRLTFFGLLSSGSPARGTGRRETRRQSQPSRPLRRLISSPHLLTKGSKKACRFATPLRVNRPVILSWQRNSIQIPMHRSIDVRKVRRVPAGHEFAARDRLGSRHYAGFASGSIPPGGSGGRFSSCPTGIARLLPGLVREGASTGTTRNLPVEDQAGIQKSAHMVRGVPPSSGIALVTTPVLSRTGTRATIHRRPGEIL